MADRSVKVTVSADVARYRSAMGQAEQATTRVAKSAGGLGSQVKRAFQFVGVTSGIAAVGAAIKGTFSLGLDFTTQLNTLQAVTGATGDEMARVSQLAKDLGNDISIPGASASDAAEAMTELAKGGLSVDQAMQAAKGTLQLAAAAQVSGAQAATIQANALNTFGLKADQAGRVADILANTANAASGEITDFAQAMAQSGSVAKLFGVSIDDTATVLGIFAKNGLIGSDAGTSLKSALTQLATPSKQAKVAMEQLGLSIYDANGNFVGMRSLTDQLSKAQGRMTQAAFNSAAGILFGSDAIRAASQLASGGVKAYDEMHDAIEKTGGAAELAGAKMKGLPGALQNMQNAAQNVALGLYEKLAPAVESVINGFSDAINTVGPVVIATFGAIFNVIGTGVTVVGKLLGVVDGLSGPIKAVGLALVGMAIANKIGILGKLQGAFSGVGSAVSGLRGAWSRIGDDAAMAGVSRMRAGIGLVRDSAERAGSSLLGAFGGPWGVAAAAGLAIVGKAVSEIQDEMHLTDQAIADNKIAIKGLGDAYTTTGGQITKVVREQAWNQIVQDSPEIVDWAKKQGISLDQLVDAYLQLPSGNAVRDKLSAWGKSEAEMGGSGFQRTAAGMGLIAGISGPMVGSMGQSSDAMQEQADKAALVASKVDLFLGTNNQAIQAYRDQAQAVDGSTAATEQNAEALAGAAQQQNDYVTGLQVRGTEVKASRAAEEGLAGATDKGTAAAQAKADADDLAFNKARRLAVATGDVKDAVVDLSGVTRSLALQDIPAWQKSLQAARDEASSLSDTTDLLIETMERLGGREPDVEKATRDFEQSLADMIEKAKDADGNVQKLGAGVVNAKGEINLGTQAGRDLSSELEDMSKNALTMAASVGEAANKTGNQTAAAKAARDATQKARDEFIKTAEKLGLTADQAQILADKYGLIPSKVETTLKAKFDDTNLRAALNSITQPIRYVNIRGKYVGTDNLPTFNFGAANNFAADGAWVTGGSPGRDSVPYMLMPGEAVIPTKNAQANKPLVQALIDGKMLPGMAGGGIVGDRHRPIASVSSSPSAPVVREVNYNIEAVPSESVDSLVSKIDRRSMFYERV